MGFGRKWLRKRPGMRSRVKLTANRPLSQQGDAEQGVAAAPLSIFEPEPAVAAVVGVAGADAFLSVDELAPTAPLPSEVVEALAGAAAFKQAVRENFFPAEQADRAARPENKTRKRGPAKKKRTLKR